MSETSLVPQPQRVSLLAKVATQYSMEPKAFAETIKATVFPNGKATNEQLAAFLMVADQYHLNPITKEIYAFPTKGGGVMPVVSIDGWLKLVNNHPACDGIVTDDIRENGKLVAVRCRIYRKDRQQPTEVTEYMAECNRDTEPWRKWPARMIRHKAVIQCARYAFGFSGIYDQDEAERISGTDQSRHATIARANELAAKYEAKALRAPAPEELSEADVIEPEHVQVCESAGLPLDFDPLQHGDPA